MQVVILAGGTGTRLREETEFRPKAMVPIGGKPIIFHIMKSFAHYGFDEFVIALGYRQGYFKEYFRHFHEINNDVVVTTGRNRGMDYHDGLPSDDWKVTLSDTGLNTLKGGRLKRIQKYIEGDNFLLAYGDGLSDIDFKALVKFHELHKRMITVVGVHPPGRFGEIHRDGARVLSFTEKPPTQSDSLLINAGFYVCNTKIFDYLTTDEWCDLERGPMELIANKGEMAVYHHTGFWRPMDTLNDMMQLEILWEKGAPWKTW